MSEMLDNGLIFQNLAYIASETGCKILFADFQGCSGRIKGNRIGIKIGMSIDEINYNLAHEIAHFHLHYDKGDTIIARNTKRMRSRLTERQSFYYRR